MTRNRAADILFAVTLGLAGCAAVSAWLETAQEEPATLHPAPDTSAPPSPDSCPSWTPTPDTTGRAFET